MITKDVYKCKHCPCIAREYKGMGLYIDADVLFECTGAGAEDMRHDFSVKLTLEQRKQMNAEE